MKRFILIIIAVFCTIFACFSQALEDKYYGKHIIIAIDQTPDVQKHQDINMVKGWIQCLLTNRAIDKSELDAQSIFPKDFYFDEKNDRISLFAFGMEGASDYYPSSENQFMRIKRMCQNSNPSVESVNRDFMDALFTQKKRFDYSMDSLSIDRYLNKVISPLLSGDDAKALSIGRNSGVTFSYYVFPTILNMLDVSVPAEEYYLFMVTNFKSGSADGVNTEDERRLSDMLPFKYREGFNEMLSGLNNEYTRTKVGALIPKANDKAGKRPQIIIYRLKSLALFNSSENADIESNIDIHEKEYNGKVFKMDSVIVKLADTSIRMIVMDLKDEYGGLLYHEFIADNIAECHSLQAQKKYVLPSKELYLPKLKKEGDILDFKYIFYPEINTNDKLPVVYTAERKVGIDENNFAPEPILPGPGPEPDDYWWILFGIFSILLIAFFLFWMRKKCGENRKVDVKFDILPISNARYMNVEGNKVVNLDCWYLEINKDIRNITVEGKIVFEDLRWAKKCDYRLEYLIEDCDTDDMFTFRPEAGGSKSGDRKANEWYGVSLEDNSFHFRVQSYLDKTKHPELNNPNKVVQILETENHIHKLKVVFRIRLLDTKDSIFKIFNPKKWKETLSRLEENVTLSKAEEDDYVVKTIETDSEGRKFEKEYSYVVRPYYQKSDAWVSFDPGTTGSCVALGSSGLPIDMNNIHLALNKEEHAGDSESTYNPIFPSKIRITDRSQIFNGLNDCVDEAGHVINVENMEEGSDNDFTFGNDADNRLGNNIFQSIKKLLGFQTMMKVYDNNRGRVYKISGKDLACLIVKGLYKQVEEYAMTDLMGDNRFRQFYLDENGRFSPQRAIVAVPNNYTIAKVQEMVDTVKRIGKFREVHYLYESEAVLMTYCRKEYANLPQKEGNIIIVYDMGGATINATAFDMRVRKRGTEIDQVTIETISKIGYCFGGDDIDYYIIRSLYDTKAIRNLFMTKEGYFLEDNMKKHMQQNKQQLIKLATKIKLDMVAESQKRKKREFQTSEELVNEVDSRIREMGYEKGLDSDDKKSFYEEFRNEINKNLEKFVYPIVRDAVKELVTSLDESYRTKKAILVFSGRSSAFPGVKSNVEHVIKEHFYNDKYECWNGFNDQDGNLDIDKVKTAVAIGGNWYALFSKRIRLEHNLVPTTVGFIDLRNNKRTFVPIIEKNQKFENGQIIGKQTPSEVLGEVEFVQMQGSDYEGILNDYYGENASRNRHKLNKLELVRQSVIDGKINEIQIELDDKNNFYYWIISNNTIKRCMENNKIECNNPYSVLNGNKDIKLEIADENNDSFVYAVSQFQGEGVSGEELVVNKDKKIDSNNKKKRI